MDPSRSALGASGSGVGPSTPSTGSLPGREHEGAPLPPITTSPTSHTHSVPQSTPHHHHHHHHHPQTAPISSSDRPGYSSSLPQSANSAPPQRTPSMSTPNPIGGTSRQYNFGSSQSAPPIDPYRSSGNVQVRIRGRTPPSSAPKGPPSVSPQPAPGSVRPDVPMFGGMRSLPSPFDNSRDGQAGPGGQSAHHRTGSSSSARAGYPQQISAPPPAARREFTPPHQPHPYVTNPETRRQEIARSPTSRPSQTAAPPNAGPKPSVSTLSSSAQQRHPSAYPSSYSSTYHPAARQAAVTSAGQSHQQFFAQAAAGGIGMNNADAMALYNRERDRERERERDRERERAAQASRDLQRDREFAERERRQRDLQRDEVKRAQGDAFLADVRRRDREDEERRKAAAAASSKSTAPGARPGYPQEPGSLISQVAPTREPRPYNYKAEPLPNNPPSASNGNSQQLAQAAAQRQREYMYGGRERERERDPTENRSRMDLAVEEQNKRSATAAVTAVARKRKKEDGVSASKTHRQSTTAVPAPRRDWRDLTEVGKPFTPIEERVVKRWWGDNQTDMVLTYEYNGSTIGDLGLNSDWVGGRVDVRVGPGYLSRAWKLPGEDGWAEADTLSHGDALGLKAGAVSDGPDAGDVRLGQIWGTQVYTDDSALGCILVHGGHIAWMKDEDLDPDRREREFEADGLSIMLRILPPMTLYVGNTKNGIKSLGWGNGHDGFSVMVESLKRIPNYRKSVLRESGRKRLKSRMRDFNAQRMAAQGERGLAGEKEALVFSPGGMAVEAFASFKYHPDALADWLVVVHGEKRSIWKCDLELKCGSDLYLLQEERFNDSANAEITLRSAVGEDGEDKEPSITAPIDRYTWTDDGLVVRTDEGKGLLYVVDAYRWIRNPNYPQWAKEARELERDEAMEE